MRNPGSLTIDKIPRQLGALLELLGIATTDNLEFKNLTTEQRRDLISWLYRILDTLDSKTSHLLRYMSLMLTTQSILSAIAINQQVFPDRSKFAVAVIAAILVPLVGTFVALFVFRVRWPFLDWTTLPGQKKAHSATFADELVALANVCETRTRWHGCVWWLSLASAVVMFTSILALLGGLICNQA